MKLSSFTTSEEYTQKARCKKMDKKFLAAIATKPQIKLRRTQLICYISLILNFVLIVTLLLVFIR